MPAVLNFSMAIDSSSARMHAGWNSYFVRSTSESRTVDDSDSLGFMAVLTKGPL